MPVDLPTIIALDFMQRAGGLVTSIFIVYFLSSEALTTIEEPNERTSYVSPPREASPRYVFNGIYHLVGYLHDPHNSLRLCIFLH